MGDFLDYFKKKKNLASLLILGILILGLPIAIRLLEQQQIIKSRAQRPNPIAFITSDSLFQQRDGTWATTSNSVSFNVTSPFGPPSGASPTPGATPTPTPRPAVATPTPTPTSAPTATPVPAETEDFGINLKQGWNLISFPRSLAGGGSVSVFNAIADKVYYFDSSSGSWQYAFAQGIGWTGTISTLQAGKGYWVNALRDSTLTVEIKKKDSMPGINLTPGIWHMVGYFVSEGFAPTDVQSYLTKLGVNVTGSDWSVYRDDNGAWAWVLKRGTNTDSKFSQFEKGRGYWVCPSTSCGMVPVQPGG